MKSAVSQRAAAQVHGIDALFNPSSIAFLGASDRPNTPASRGLRNCLRLGFKGALYPVNPKYETLFGVPCHGALADLPEVPELVMIGLGAEKTLDAVADCEAMGVGTVIICSAGWEEQGEEGRARARELEKVIQRGRLRVLGPNCLGAGHPAIGMSLGYNSSFESLRHERRGRIGLVTQSGAMLGGLLLNAEDAGADVALYAHIGNGMDIGMEEIADYLLDQPGIGAVALMIEGLRDPARFLAVARRAQSIGKPIVAFKAGRSELGREAVMSHTGALAGSDEVFSAICEETSIIRVDEAEDLLSSAALLARWRDKQPVGRKGLVVFTLSGGAASIVADDCAAAGLPLAEFSPETHAKLEALLPFYVKVGNPFDVGGAVFSDPELPRAAMAIALADENVDSILWVGVGAPRDDRSRLWLAQALDVLSDSDKPGILVPVSGYLQEPGFERAREMGVPVARSIRSAVALVARARQANEAPLPQGSLEGFDLPALPAATDGGFIDEVQSKRLLEALGIRVPESRIASTLDELARHADTLGYPLVLKGLVEGVMHKSELGLVALNLGSADAVVAAAQAMQARNPETRFSGFLVERMAPKGLEVVLGIKRDESFGPILMFGLGGIFVEIFKDVAFGACPMSPQRARALIDKTKAAIRLRGFRGEPVADEDALVDAMVRVSRFAAGHASEIREMDINPLLVLPKGEGVIALDAMILRDVATPAQG
ncbi:acetate--CoA ligase family protein [Castellaniella sp. GW247-6E4]|uniref:acetate--CoA ligase family protein n=1 Tax=Castellaniella sp. GW247-6E4 TaxID=3140380 RepID=UPI00331625AF